MTSCPLMENNAGIVKGLCQHRLEQHAGKSNNVIVLPEEAQTIRSVIPAIETELDILEQEAQVLEAKRSSLQSRLQNLRVAVAPHKKLPVEILLKIFSYCNSGCISIPFDIRPNRAPWSLRHVCSTWRQIVLGYHQLWRSVDVLCRCRMECRPALSDAQPWGSRLHIARRILPTLGPVSIALATQEEGMQLAQSDVREGLLELVGHYVGRLQHLSLDCPLWGLAIFLRLPPDFLKDVKRLTMEGSLYSEEDPGIGYAGLLSNTGVFSMTRALRDLGVRGEADLLEAVVAQQIPWHQLTDLSFEYIQYNRLSSGGPTWDQFFPILRQCVSLKRCTVRLAKTGSQGYNKSVQAELPHLQHLSLRMPDSYALDNLTLPSLTHLQLSIGQTFPVEGLLGLVDRSGCIIRSLIDRPVTLQNPIDSRAFITLLKTLPSLKVLSTHSILCLEDIRAIARAELLPSADILRFRSGMSAIDVTEVFRQACSTSGSCTTHTNEKHISVLVCTSAEQPTFQDLINEVFAPEYVLEELDAFDASGLVQSEVDTFCDGLLFKHKIRLVFDKYQDGLTRRLL